MDQNPITLDDSNKASSNTDLHPNRDELKGNSEFPIKASPTKGIRKIPVDKICDSFRIILHRKSNSSLANNCMITLF